jgi:hypothetical protein
LEKNPVFLEENPVLLLFDGLGCLRGTDQTMVYRGVNELMIIPIKLRLESAFSCIDNYSILIIVGFGGMLAKLCGGQTLRRVYAYLRIAYLSAASRCGTSIMLRVYHVAGLLRGRNIVLLQALAAAPVNRA